MDIYLDEGDAELKVRCRSTTVLMVRQIPNINAMEYGFMRSEYAENALTDQSIPEFSPWLNSWLEVVPGTREGHFG
jgi:hypothetical protein